MKACPFCAEEIQDAAIVCKHCGRDLPPAVATWESEARALSRETGKSVHAVQRVKIANPSMSLKDAKNLVDRWQREDGTAPPAPKTGGLTGKLTGTQQLLYGGIALFVILLCCGGVPRFLSGPTAPPAQSGSSAPSSPAAKAPPASVPMTKSSAVTSASTPKAPQAPAGTKVISGDTWFGCVDRDQFGKLVRYATQGDADAFKRGLATGMLAGTCTTFNNGEAVYVVDSAILSGALKVRRKGETAEFWTNVEAVK